MARMVFDEHGPPPEQAVGVYRLYYRRRDDSNDDEITFYIGMSESDEIDSGTLARGEAVDRLDAPFARSESGKKNLKKLDTNFIVGTAIRYLEERENITCYWQHISDDPTYENKRELCDEHDPKLQRKTGRRDWLSPELYLEKGPNEGIWQEGIDEEEATTRLYREFDRIFGLA